jgi:hypothetical protein
LYVPFTSSDNTPETQGLSTRQKDQYQARANTSQSNPSSRNLETLIPPSTVIDHSGNHIPPCTGTTKSGNQKRKDRQQGQISRHLTKTYEITRPEILAASLLETNLGWSGSLALGKKIEVHQAEDLKLIGDDIKNLGRASSILFAYHCLFVYEVVLKLSGKPSLDVKGLHMIVKSLSLQPNLNDLVTWATTGCRYKPWVEKNGYWVILFVGGKNSYESETYIFLRTNSQ